MNDLTPIQQQDRIHVLDILRGIAIFGILIVNMGMLNTPYIYLQYLNESWFTGVWDRVTQQWIDFFAQGKFYNMLSFLFGFGFILFLHRVEDKTLRPRLLFLRRLIVLFVIGLIHAYLLWYGDILTTYALGGCLLLAFARCKPKTLLIWALSIVMIVALILLFFAWFFAMIENVEPDLLSNQHQVELMQQKVAASLYAYGEGTFAELMRQRIEDFHFAFSNVYQSILLVFPMFLIGAYAAKRNMIQSSDRHRTFIRRVWLFSLVIGVLFNGLKLWSLERIDPNFLSVYDFYHSIAIIIGDPALSLFYITSVVILAGNIKWQRWLSPFAHVGRMALSHYLFQSIVLTTIFYSYGFGLYGQVGPFIGLWISVILFGVQLIISPYWFKRFRYGPVEWLWRSLTYRGFGRPLPIRDDAQ